jgi:hypothetical protein
MESLGMYYMDDNDKSNENSLQDENFLMINNSKLNKGINNIITNQINEN